MVLEDCGRLARIPGQWAILRTGDGAQWSQLEGEPIEAFKARATAAAADGFAAAGALAVRLVMVRPRLSFAGWQRLHSMPA